MGYFTKPIRKIRHMAKLGLPQPYDLCKAALEHDGLALQYVREKTAELCDIALRKNGAALQFVPPELHTIERYFLAVAHSAAALAFVDARPCTADEYCDICEMVFNDHGEDANMSLVDRETFIKAQNGEARYNHLCKLAAENGRLEGIAQPTAKLCEIAVKKNPNALAFVPEDLLTANLCRIAVEKDANALRYVPEYFRTNDLCLDAVNKNPKVLQYVKEQTPEVCRAAIKKQAGVISQVRDQTEDLCWFALEQDYEMINKILKPTVEMLAYTEAKRAVAAERKRLFDEEVRLFNEYLPLIYKKRDIIKAEPRFYSMPKPTALWGTSYVTFNNMGDHFVTLGELIELWENEPAFTAACKCGGTGVLYTFAGSPLSGSVWLRCRCIVCDEQFEGGHGKGLNIHGWRDVVAIRNKYHPKNPIAENPASYAELIAALEGRTLTEPPPPPSGLLDPGQSYIQLGRNPKNRYTFSFTNEE
ncbi:hypothetical protein AGMMS49944_14980 [Spirochaetia bacterium]|nr:hypothetical protein AGMMS49944_14980 [Spirochaetia bacterium]